MEQSDLFGNVRLVDLNDNPVLQRMAERLLDMCQRDPSLLSGDSVGEIDRKISASVWLDDGLSNLIPSDQRQRYFDIMAKATEGEVITRARRWLTEKDLIRLPASVIRKSEQSRSRISQAMH